MRIIFIIFLLSSSFSRAVKYTSLENLRLVEIRNNYSYPISFLYKSHSGKEKKIYIEPHCNANVMLLLPLTVQCLQHKPCSWVGKFIKQYSSKQIIQPTQTTIIYENKPQLLQDSETAPLL